MSSDALLSAFVLIILAACAGLAIWDEKKTGEISILLFLMVILTLPILGIAAAMILVGNLLLGGTLALCAVLAIAVFVANSGVKIIPPMAIFSALLLLALSSLGIS